jgi:hypothetical protein
MTNPQQVWRFMPLAILALAVQLLLPVGMVRAAVAAADPFGHRTICRVTPADPAGTDDGKSSHAPSHCPLCLLAAHSGALLAAGTAAVPMPGAARPAMLSDPAQSAGPRGPPLWRPGARAPPRIS